MVSVRRIGSVVDMARMWVRGGHRDVVIYSPECPTDTGIGHYHCCWS